MDHTLHGAVPCRPPSLLSSAAGLSFRPQQVNISTSASTAAPHMADWKVSAFLNLTHTHPVQAKMYASLALASPRFALLVARLIDPKAGLWYLQAIAEARCACKVKASMGLWEAASHGRVDGRRTSDAVLLFQCHGAAS